MTDTRSGIKQGLLWLGTASAAMRVIELVSQIVVLWILTKEEVGLASLAWSVAVFLEAFNGLGVGVAIIQARDLERRQLDGLFWFTMGVGALFTGGVAAASPWIAEALEAPALAGMVAVSALRLLFMAVALVPVQLLNRNLGFKQLAAITTTAGLLAAITKIVLAALGFGAWAMVLAHTGEGLFTAVLVYMMAPFWPRLRFAFAEIKGFIRFGLKAATSTILYHGYRNLDFVIIGRVFGPTVLGAYRVAFDVAMIPITAIKDVANRTALPIYSRIGIENADRMRTVHLWMIRSLLLIVGPIAVVLFLAGPELVVTIAGSTWESSGPYIRVLAWAALLRSLDQVVPPLFHASNRPGLAAWDSLFTAIVFSAMAALGLAVSGDTLGANAISLAWVGTYLVMLMVLRRMAHAVVGLPLTTWLANLAGPGLAIATMVAAGLGVERILPPGLPRWASTAALVVTTVVVAGAWYRGVLGLHPKNLWPHDPEVDREAEPGETDES